MDTSSSHLPLFSPTHLLTLDTPFCSFGLQVTVMHSMYAGYMEKAIRYSEKALVQVDRLKCEYWEYHCRTSVWWTPVLRTKTSHSPRNKGSGTYTKAALHVYTLSQSHSAVVILTMYRSINESMNQKLS